MSFWVTLLSYAGTLKTKKVEELIVYVENPLERLETATMIVEDWLGKSQDSSEEKLQYLRELEAFNRIVAQNDLPEFYDPIESDQFKDNLDSYNFTSVYNFMTNTQRRQLFDIRPEGTALLYKILMVWLARILSEKLLAEVIYTILQI